MYNEEYKEFNCQVIFQYVWKILKVNGIKFDEKPEKNISFKTHLYHMIQLIVVLTN